MTANSFKTVIRNPGATAPAGNPTYATDAVDRAVYALGTSSPASPSHVLAYIRAKKWPTASGFGSGLIDRLGNPLSSGTYATDAVKNATDSNFNGQASIDLTAVAAANGGANNGPWQIGPGFRLNGSLTTLPPSFTFVLPARLNTGAPSANSIFSTTDGVAIYCLANGNCDMYVNGSADASFSTSSFTPGTAGVAWFSYDSSTRSGAWGSIRPPFSRRLLARIPTHRRRTTKSGFSPTAVWSTAVRASTVNSKAR